MKKPFQYLVWCLVIGFSIASMAQNLTVKTDPPTDGPAPYKYIAPLLNPDDLITVYPQNTNYWTGTTDGASLTDVSEVRGLNLEDGWFIFDVSGIPDGATINAITFSGYVNSTTWPYWSATPMGPVNPLIDPPATIKAQIEGNSAQGVAYVYSNEGSGFATGWHSYPFEPQALPDLQAALTQNWFAVGMDSRDNSTSYWINWDGWNQANDPYLEVDYTLPLAHDVGTESVNVPAIIGTGPFTPAATIFSSSTMAETFDVTMTITPGGYSSTKTVTNLQPASSVNLLFDNWTPAVGTYSVEVCTQLGTDPNSANNCASTSVDVQSNVTPAFGYNAYDQTSTYPLGTLAFLCQTPGTMTVTGGVVTDFMCAGTFDTWTQTWYGYQYPGNAFWRINPISGELESIGSSSAAMRGLAYDPTTTADGQLFAVDIDILYSIDETTGASTMIGASGLALDYIALACSPSGQLYGFDMTNNALYMINKSTGAATQVAPFPFDVTYAQGADYDYDNNILYWGAWDSGLSQGRFYIVDPSTAGLTQIGFNGTSPGLELDAMGVFSSSPVPVELTSFTADVTEANVTLKWSTATETNNQGFEVQRSQSNGGFESVGFVNGNGTTTEMQYYSYTDAGLTAGTYNYRLKQVDYDGSFEYFDAIVVEVGVPDVFALNQNYPNPFNPSTRIDFSLASDSKVTLKIYDLLGQEVATLLNSNLVAGVHYVNFDAAGVNSGVYFYRIEATGVNGNNFVDVKKMILTK